MAKLLKSLVVVLLVLAVTALVLGNMLFRQRELLKGRTQLLESALMQLAVTLEAFAPRLTAKPTYPERDIESVTATLVSKPERGEFWPTYDHNLEQGPADTLDLTPKRDQLMRYYRMDPLTGKPMRDPVTRLRVTDGPDTMRELLDNVIARAVAQFDRLNATRHELRRTRGELVDTIGDLNTKKGDLRTALVTIEDRDGSIVRLEDTVRQRDGVIDDFRQQVVSLNDTVHAKKLELENCQEEIIMLNQTVEEQQYLIEKYRTPTNEELVKEWIWIPHGIKGNIAAICAEMNFVVVRFSTEFIAEYMRALEKEATRPDPDMLVWRSQSENPEQFVTKVKLCHVNPKTRLGVATILNGWQQMAIAEGDVVAY